MQEAPEAVYFDDLDDGDLVEAVLHNNDRIRGIYSGFERVKSPDQDGYHYCMVLKPAQAPMSKHGMQLRTNQILHVER